MKYRKLYFMLFCMGVQPGLSLLNKTEIVGVLKSLLRRIFGPKRDEVT